MATAGIRGSLRAAPPVSEPIFPPRPGEDDVGAFAPFLARARASDDGSADPRARVALGAYLILRLVDRVVRTPADALDEGLVWQRQSTLRFLRDLPDGGAEPAHLLGLADALSADVPQRLAILRVSLIAYAFFLEQEGRYDEALAVLAVAGSGGPLLDPQYVSLALQTARLNRLLARWDEAVRCYRLARAQALRLGDRRSALLSRLGEANVRRGRGDLPGARLAVEALIADARAEGLTDVEARGQHDLAATLDRLGMPHEAVLAVYRAFELYQDMGDRTRALGDLGVFLRALGQEEPARHAFAAAWRAGTSWQVRHNALIGLMELESACGNELGFRRRADLARRAVEQMPPSMATDFHYNLGIGWARFGRLARARAALGEAARLAAAHGLHQWSFRVEQVAAGLDAAMAECAAVSHQPAAGPPALEPVAAGIRAFAMAAGAA